MNQVRAGKGWERNEGEIGEKNNRLCGHMKSQCKWKMSMFLFHCKVYNAMKL